MVSQGIKQAQQLGLKGIVGDSASGTVKENASIVDSSLTECKHDLENCNGPESSISKDNEDYNCGTEAEQMHPSCDMVGSSHMTNVKLYTRYFVIKSLSHHNIELSVEKGIWATQVMNEPILEEAFHNSDRVILIFSVNMSGFFQGYAQMMSPVSWKRDNVWSKSGSGNNPWGRTFKVRWLRLCDLPFQKTLHLKNPLNDYKPVKISRDCQELSAGIGEALCGLFSGEVYVTGKLKRTSSSVDDDLPKRPCRSSPVHFEDEDCMVPEPSLMRWEPSAMLHPSVLYQHLQNEENFHHVMIGRSPRLSFPQNSYPYLELESNLYMKQPFLHKNMPENRNDNRQSTKKNMPFEESPLVPLTEDDLLSMVFCWLLKLCATPFVIGDMKAPLRCEDAPFKLLFGSFRVKGNSVACSQRKSMPFHKYDSCSVADVRRVFASNQEELFVIPLP